MCGPLLLLPALLVLPVLLLASAVVALARLGPAGVLAGVLLVAAVVGSTALGVRAGLAWWRSTAAPR